MSKLRSMPAFSAVKADFNINAKLPTLIEVVKFALARGYRPRVVGLSIPEAANVVFSTAVRRKAPVTRAELETTGWPFTYAPSPIIGQQNEFIVAVVL